MARTKQTTRKSTGGLAPQKVENKGETELESDSDEERAVEHDYPDFEDITPTPGEETKGTIPLTEHLKRMKTLRKFILDKLEELDQEKQEFTRESQENTRLRHDLEAVQTNLKNAESFANDYKNNTNELSEKIKRLEFAYQDNRKKLEKCDADFRTYRREYDLGLAHKKAKISN